MERSGQKDARKRAHSATGSESGFEGIDFNENGMLTVVF